MDSERDDVGRRGYRVAVAGVGGPQNRPGRNAAGALLAVVVVLAGGVLLSRLAPADRGLVSPSASSAVAFASSAPSSSSPERPSAPTPAASGLLTARPLGIPLTPRLLGNQVGVAALVAAVPRRGTGPLAFVEGQLTSATRPCGAGAPLSACLTLRIAGLSDATIVPDDTMAYWPGDPGPGETLVLVPRNGRLVFLGSLVVNPAGIPPIDTLQALLAADPASAANELPSLHEADGILSATIDPCGGTTSCRPAAIGSPLLLSTAPDGSGITSMTPVEVVPQAVGVRSAGSTGGPFLLRHLAVSIGPVWEVVAREGPGSILHVVIP